MLKKKKELLLKRFSKSVKTRIVKTLIRSAAMFACETWTLRKEEADRLNVLEMWIWRKMKRISWSEKKTNEQVLSEARKDISLGKRSEKEENLDRAYNEGRGTDETCHGEKEREMKTETRYDPEEGLIC